MARHPLEVTCDRLVDHFERYWDYLEPREKDAISLITSAFHDIVEGKR